MATTYYKGGYMRDDGIWYDSLGDAADDISELGMDTQWASSAILRAAKLGRRAYGFRWAQCEYPDTPLSALFGREWEVDMTRQTQAVMAGPTDGRWWPSIADAATAIAAETGLTFEGLRAGIRNCAARERGTAGGFEWRRCDDPYMDPLLVFGLSVPEDDSAPEAPPPMRWKPGLEVYVRMADRTLARARILRVLPSQAVAQVSVSNYQEPVWQYTERLVRA
jgi:hypothetical protein